MYQGETLLIFVVVQQQLSYNGFILDGALVGVWSHN
jgi:hypothetical protein